MHSIRVIRVCMAFQDKDLAELSNRECLLGSANNIDATNEAGDNYSNAVVAAAQWKSSGTLPKRPLSAPDIDNHCNMATVAYQHVASSSLCSSMLQASSACNSNSAGETVRPLAATTTGNVCHSYSEQSPVHLRSFAPLSTIAALRPSIRIIEAEV